MKDKIINSFSNNLKKLVHDLIIQDKKIFVTLKAENFNQAKEFQRLKEECEQKITNFNLFDEINVTFTTIKKSKVSLQRTKKQSAAVMICEQFTLQNMQKNKNTPFSVERGVHLP